MPVQGRSVFAPECACQLQFPRNSNPHVDVFAHSNKKEIIFRLWTFQRSPVPIAGDTQADGTLHTGAARTPEYAPGPHNQQFGGARQKMSMCTEGAMDAGPFNRSPNGKVSPPPALSPGTFGSSEVTGDQLGTCGQEEAILVPVT
jgi:hypothetical protein